MAQKKSHNDTPFQEGARRARGLGNGRGSKPTFAECFLCESIYLRILHTLAYLNLTTTYVEEMVRT